MLKYQPTLQTERLRLRPFVADDAPDVQRLAGDREVADTTIGIPHPYSLGAARTWIAGLPHYFRTETGFYFAIALRDSRELVGSVSLHDIDRENAQAELSFWVGVPYWGCGYGSEASRELIGFAYSKLALNRIYAHHLARNPGAGGVLTQLGMKQEGVLRQRVRKWDLHEDVVVYSVLREDWPSLRPDAEGDATS